MLPLAPGCQSSAHLRAILEAAEALRSIGSQLQSPDTSLPTRCTQVDFSQSVSHLWRQFKTFGNKADGVAGESANSGAPGGGRGGACFGGRQ